MRGTDKRVTQNLKQSLDGTGEVHQACETGVSTRTEVGRCVWLGWWGVGGGDCRIVELDIRKKEKK